MIFYNTLRPKFENTQLLQNQFPGSEYIAVEYKARAWSLKVGYTLKPLIDLLLDKKQK